MHKISVVFLSLLAAYFILSPLSPVGATEPVSFEETSVGGTVETIEGAVDTVNAEKKTVTIRWMDDPVMMRYENVSLEVLPSTVLLKNSSPIELRDIEAGDHATVRYDPYAAPMAKALSIDIEE